ncbi:MAG: glycosyltransferase family 39 protein [Bacteroidetes bacterium]|nr:glycosyltransferase family 39 protein [Bacteroidota bacterium]
MQANLSIYVKKLLSENILKRWYLILPAVLIFIYIIIRATVVSLTWDEAHTFFEYVRNPNWLLRDYNYMSANNHLLNTWLMKISIFLFGQSELALRLPNVLAGGLFLFLLVRLLTKIFSDWKMQLIGFILLACNPYVIDYFSIARGYGISISLMLGGIYFFYKFISTSFHTRDGLFALLLFAFATLANLTCIHLLISSAFLLACAVFYLGNNEGKTKKIILFISFPILFISLLAPYVFKLQHANAFFLGKEATSPLAIIASLGDAFAYGANYSTWLSPLLVKLFYLIPALALFEIFRRRKFIRSVDSTKALFFLTAFFLVSFLTPIIQHYVMGTNFLSGRTALIFLPQLFFLLILVVKSGGRVVQYVVSLLAIFLLIHFSIGLNKKSFYDFKEQADVKSAMQLLHSKNILPEGNCYANIISSDLPFEEQINYYRMRFGMNNFGHTSRKESVPICSYYYLTAAAMKDLHQEVDVIQEFPDTKTFLFRIRHRQELKKITEVWQDFEKEDPFPQLKKDTIYLGEQGTYAGGDYQYGINVGLDVPDSLNGNLVASVNCRLYYFTRTTSALLVFAFENGKEENWDAMHINELPENPCMWTLTSWTRPVPAGTKKVRVYLWNRDKTPVLLDNVAIRLLSYPK